MKKNYTIEESDLYKRNIKIHRNLWKPYAISLLIGICVVIVKGLN